MRKTTSEPNAPYPELTPARPRYHPSKNCPTTNRNDVTAEPTQTSRHSIWHSGKYSYNSAKAPQSTPNDTAKSAIFMSVANPGNTCVKYADIIVRTAFTPIETRSSSAIPSITPKLETRWRMASLSVDFCGLISHTVLSENCTAPIRP